MTNRFISKKTLMVFIISVLFILILIAHQLLYLTRPKDPYVKTKNLHLGHILSGSYSFHKEPSLSFASKRLSFFVQEQLKDLPFIIDSHMHLAGQEYEKNKTYLNPTFNNFYRHPLFYIKAKSFMAAFGIQESLAPDKALSQRLQQLILKFPQVPYYGFMFAFAASYDKATGNKNLKNTSFEVPNRYLLETVKDHPQLIPVGSIHPYQKNLHEEFAYLKQTGVRFLKLLPNSMHVSPDDPMCETFFHHLNHHNMTLITHVGDERAVDLAGVNNHFGNPLLYKKWLIKFPKLKIIFAHVGSEGHSRNKQGDLQDNFELVLELMDQFPTQLYADLSAFSSVPARAKYLPRLLQRPDLFDRFIYGSDYPIPCILPLFKLNLFFLEYYKLLDHIENLSQFKSDLFELYQYNPLLSALILMKNMAYKQQHLPNKIFYQTIFNLLELDANPVLLKQIR